MRGRLKWYSGSCMIDCSSCKNKTSPARPARGSFGFENSLYLLRKRLNDPSPDGDPLVVVVVVVVVAKAKNVIVLRRYQASGTAVKGPCSFFADAIGEFAERLSIAAFAL